MSEIILSIDYSGELTPDSSELKKLFSFLFVFH